MSAPSPVVLCTVCGWRNGEDPSMASTDSNHCEMCGVPLLHTRPTSPSAASYSSVNLTGKLAKKSTSSTHLWQTRYWMLNTQTLCYYQSESDSKDKSKLPSRVLKTNDFARIEVPERGKGSDTGVRFNIHMKSGARIYELQAENQSSQQQWVRALNSILTEITNKRKNTDVELTKRRSTMVEVHRANSIARRDAPPSVPLSPSSNRGDGVTSPFHVDSPRNGDANAVAASSSSSSKPSSARTPEAQHRPLPAVPQRQSLSTTNSPPPESNSPGLVSSTDAASSSSSASSVPSAVPAKSASPTIPEEVTSEDVSSSEAAAASSSSSGKPTKQSDSMELAHLEAASLRAAAERAKLTAEIDQEFRRSAESFARLEAEQRSRRESLAEERRRTIEERRKTVESITRRASQEVENWARKKSELADTIAKVKQQATEDEKRRTSTEVTPTGTPALSPDASHTNGNGVHHAGEKAGELSLDAVPESTADENADEMQAKKDAAGKQSAEAVPINGKEA